MTANQQYKASGSKMPFKAWLKEQQRLGLIESHEAQMFYADGSDATIGGVNTRTIVMVALVAVAGYYIYSKMRE